MTDPLRAQASAQVGLRSKWPFRCRTTIPTWQHPSESPPPPHQPPPGTKPRLAPEGWWAIRESARADSRASTQRPGPITRRTLSDAQQPSHSTARCEESSQNTKHPLPSLGPQPPLADLITTANQLVPRCRHGDGPSPCLHLPAFASKRFHTLPHLSPLSPACCSLTSAATGAVQPAPSAEGRRPTGCCCACTIPQPPAEPRESESERGQQAAADWPNTGSPHGSPHGHPSHPKT